MQLKVGADPEIFLYNKDRKMYVSAHNLVPGDKKNPHKVDCGAVQRDGTAAEINIDPAETSEKFVKNLDTVLAQLQKMLPDNIEMRFEPSVYYDPRYFEEEIPNEHKILGCDPDYNAYSGRANPVPRSRSTCRTGGGHVHLGWGKGLDQYDRAHIWDCREMTKRLYQHYRAWESLFDADTTRRGLYGNGAVFRPKAYGVEFRTPSNAWLGKRVLWPWIFDSTKWVFDHALAKPEKFNAAYNDHHYWGHYTPAQRLTMLFGDETYPKFPLEINNGTGVLQSGGFVPLSQQYNMLVQGAPVLRNDW